MVGGTRVNIDRFAVHCVEFSNLEAGAGLLKLRFAAVLSSDTTSERSLLGMAVLEALSSNF